MSSKAVRLLIATTFVMTMMLSLASPVGAVCIRIIPAPPTATDIGTAGVDQIICNSTNQPAGNVQGRNGNDIITIDASPVWNTASDKDAKGDDSPTPGNDTITITNDWDDIIGDDNDSSGVSGGDDSIVLTSDGGSDADVDNVWGDLVWGSGADGGNDTIFVDDNADITNDIRGDDSDDDGGDDSIVVEGIVDDIYGDYLDGNGKLGDSSPGDDTIIVEGTVRDDVFGDYTFGAAVNNFSQGNDSIRISGRVGDSLNSTTVTHNVYGDWVQNGDGGDDTIRVQVGATVEGDVIGDEILLGGDAGNDSIRIAGTVNDDVVGDGGVPDTSGVDTIKIFSNGLVRGDVIGDDASGLGGNDDIDILGGEVDGTIYGDDVTAGANGGNDNILIDDNSDVQDVVGDDAAGDGGDDVIYVDDGATADDIVGDYAGDNGGDDTITIDNAVTDEVRGDEVDDNPGNDSITVTGSNADVTQIWGDQNKTSDFGSTTSTGKGGDDTIRVQSGAEVNSVFGDGGTTSGGNDSIVINTNTTVNNNVYGDNLSFGSGGDDFINIGGSVGGNVLGDYTILSATGGGDDTIIVGTSGTVDGDVTGDHLSDAQVVTGGNDSISINGDVLQDVAGDRVGGDGGDDTIRINTLGNVTGDVIGDDLSGVDALGGKDSIVVSGSVQGDVTGDDNNFAARSRRDTITVSGTVDGSVSGDRTKKAGSKDTITISGDVGKSVYGDNTNRAGGDDSIVVTSTGNVTNNVVGDLVKTISGGNDTIVIEGTVGKNVFGDNFRSSAKADADGGNDSIWITSTGVVEKNVVGDSAPDDGGKDTIVVDGLVKGDVYGDDVGDLGGLDSIVINGTVEGDVLGDKSGTPANVGTVGADDTIIITGVVNGTVDPDGSIGGHDVVVVAGQITGNIASSHDNGIDGDDIFVITDGGVVGGLMDPGSHVNGDSLVFDLSTKSKGEFNKLSALFEDLGIEDGSVRYRGNRYKWVNFEFLQYVIQFLETRYVELRCSGIYEKNDAGTACQRKGAEEYDAIMFHRNNPGYDGRLPGTEACAIYNYGNAMRVYEVVDGSEGELVTTISVDVFNHKIESNLMLASSASGNVNVYYLTSNEVQVECTDWTGKTQVRIIPDFSGTVNASFDKSV